MQTGNIGFGAIKADAIKKGMVLRKNSGYGNGAEKIVLKKEKLLDDSLKITFKWLSPAQGTNTFHQHFKKEQMIDNFDLVGWAKKTAKKLLP